MKRLKTKIIEFYEELSSTHQYYEDNGVLSGDVCELKEEFEKNLINDFC